MANEQTIEELKRQASLAQTIVEAVRHHGIQVIRAGHQISGFTISSMETLAAVESLGLRTELLEVKTNGPRMRDALAAFSKQDLQQALGHTAIVDEMFSHILKHSISTDQEQQRNR